MTKRTDGKVTKRTKKGANSQKISNSFRKKAPKVFGEGFFPKEIL